jgi:hypothetical protein
MIFLWKAFKKLKSEKGVDNVDATDFQKENYKFIVELLKIFLHPPPPLEREILLGLLNQQYIKYIFCQHKNGIVKSIFCGLSLAISHNELDSCLKDFKEELTITLDNVCIVKS